MGQRQRQGHSRRWWKQVSSQRKVRDQGQCQCRGWGQPQGQCQPQSQSKPCTHAHVHAHACLRRRQGPAQRAKSRQSGWKQHADLPAHGPPWQCIGGYGCQQAGALPAGVRPVGQGTHWGHKAHHAQLHGAEAGRHGPSILPRKVLRPRPCTLQLTVDFHEGTLLSGLNNDNALILQKGYWFQLSGQDRRQRQAREPCGPANPQALSRYAYVLGNPLRYTDPTGHAAPPFASPHPGYVPPEEEVQEAGFGSLIASGLRLIGRILLGVGGKTIPKFTGTFRSAYYAAKHFKAHGAKMGYATEEEYVAGAQNFIAQGLFKIFGRSTTGPKYYTSDIWNYFQSKGGWHYLYNRATNEFAIIDETGNIVTYFQPTRGYD